MRTAAGDNFVLYEEVRSFTGSSTAAAAFKAMQSRFGNDELVQLTTAIGYYSLLCMTVNTAEVEPAAGAEVLKV